MTLAGDSFMPLIVNLCAREAHKRNHAAKEQVDFMKIRKGVQHSRAYQTVVCMVVNNFCAHGIQEFVERFCGEALEEGICISLGPYAVDDFRALQILIHHLIHRTDVVLSVAVDGNRDVAVSSRLHHTGKNSILMASVAALADADVVRVFLGVLRYKVPCVVGGAVVDKKNPTLVADPVGVPKMRQFLEKKRRRDRQHLLLVVTGNDNPENRTADIFRKG